MIDPITAAPTTAQHAEAHDAYQAIAVARAYTTQAEAVAACIASNMGEAAKTIREIAGNLPLLGNRQVMEELDNRLAYLDSIKPLVEGTAEDRRALDPMLRQGELGDDEREAMEMLAELAEQEAQRRKDHNAMADDVAAQTAKLREALALLGPRPVPEPDPQEVADLAWIRRYVAPLRENGCISDAGLADTGSLVGNLEQILALDEGGEAPEVPAWVLAGAVPDVSHGTHEEVSA